MLKYVIVMLVGYLLIRKDVGYEELGYFFRVFVTF